MKFASKVLTVFALVLSMLLWSASTASASTSYRYCKPGGSYNSTLTTSYTLGVNDVLVTQVTGSNPYSLSTNTVYSGSDTYGTVASKSGGSSVTLTTDVRSWKTNGPWTKLKSTYGGVTCWATFRPV